MVTLAAPSQEASGNGPSPHYYRHRITPLPWPAALMAATRNQYLVPLVRTSTNALALVDIPVRVQDKPVY